MLWKEPGIPRSTKSRIAVYTYLIPLLIYAALTLFIFNSAQKAIEAAGGGL
jgi:hypothetical protein